MSKTTAIPEKIKRRLRGTSQLRLAVSDIRKTINPSRYLALIPWLHIVRHSGRGVFSGQFPTHITRLKRDWVFEAIPPEDEIRWATEILKYHAPRINSFIARKTNFEQILLGGSYSACSDSLDSIEKDFGLSLWSIETRIALLQSAHGLERQKGYVNGIRAARITNPVAVLAFFASERNEPATNPLHFKDLMVERAQQWEVESEYKDYLLFRLVDLLDFTEEKCAAVLRYESTSSVTDYYDCYIRLAQRAILESCLPRSFMPGLEALVEAIDDPCISKALFLKNSNKSQLSALRRQQLLSLDTLVQEDYQAAVAAAQSTVQLDAMDISARFTSAQANAELGAEIVEIGGLGSRIERLCSMLVTKRETTEDAYLETLRLTSAFHSMAFSSQLARFVRDQYSDEPLSQTSGTLNAFLNNPYLDPRELAWLPEQLKKSYSAALLGAYALSPGLVAELLRSGENLPNPEPPSFDKVFALGQSVSLDIKIHRELSFEHFNEALILARELDKCASQYTRRIAARYIAHCLLRLQRHDEAIDFVVSRTISDPAAVFMLPIAACADRLDKPARKSLAAKLSTPILLDLFSRFVSDRLDNVRAYAYEDFLIANSVERPSEILRFANRFDPRLLVYYLHRICVPEIMQVSSTFRGSQELEQERLAICSMLRQIDEQNTKEYESEIREITRNQVIQAGIRYVDKSRIFVDLVAIRRWAERNLREGFVRYRALLEAGVDTGVTAFTEALEEALANRDATRTVLALPKNEANELLADLVSKVFAECATNPEYGLDCYLSMRIRHGALSGQLRGPLEEQKIITQREGGSQKYKSNEFWLQKLNHLLPAAHRVDTRLAEFSHDYDAAIDEFAREFIQVHSVEKESGLFSKSLPELFLGGIATEIKPDTSFDDFISMCFHWFWQRVELDLKTVRKQIDEKLKPKINSLFATLQSDLESVVDGVPTPELDRAILIAQTGAQNALNQVNEWFRLRKPETAPSLTMEEIIEIGRRCVENIHPDFRPQIRQTIPTMAPLIDWTSLSDIFFIVFENIQKHSGIIRPDVEIVASETQEQLRIMVKSAVAEWIDRTEAETRVAKIKMAISEGLYQRGVRSEGGTGLMKLRKIIGQNTKTTNHLDFGFTDENEFFVELELPFREIPA